jgi:DNA-binding GntR family transcriptional regulator
VKKLRRSNLSGDAYEFIRELFVNGTRYNPGDKISVEELSRELGVSRTPLWGAINRLEAEGIVEVVPRQASVTTSERIRQMYMHMGERLGPKLAEVLPGLIDGILRCP